MEDRYPSVELHLRPGKQLTAKPPVCQQYFSNAVEKGGKVKVSQKKYFTNEDNKPESWLSKSEKSRACTERQEQN